MHMTKTTSTFKKNMIFELLGRGNSIRAICSKLHVSDKTVKSVRESAEDLACYKRCMSGFNTFKQYLLSIHMLGLAEEYDKIVSNSASISNPISKPVQLDLANIPVVNPFKLNSSKESKVEAAIKVCDTLQIFYPAKSRRGSGSVAKIMKVIDDLRVVLTS